ncbi:uncharacterized protein LOC129918816 [Episyrphus balteatus]|uniref:uncharacterized protein LOC129918816 n=1 Tax=Episyrphus balteatus TaxID=286459 RepID=UPI0024852F66|nr:uncharacterized protein LOC129918816 [Episyrphus balteatus]
MKKAKINRITILDKLHRGAVYACVGVTLYGTFLLGLRVHRFFTVVKPERQRQELKMIEEGTLENVDKTPELKY